MVAVGVTMLHRHNFEGVEDAGDQTIGLGDEVLGGVHAAADTARTHQGTNEETIVKLILASDTVVDMQLLALGEARSEVVVRQPAELQLEREGRLDVTNRLLFLPRTVHLAKRVVDGVLARTADEDRDTTNTTLAEDTAVAVDKLLDLLIPSVFRHVVGLIEDAQRHVQDIRRLVVSTVALLVLLRVEVRQSGSDLVEATLESTEVGEGRDGTSTERLLLMRVDHVRQVTNGRLPARRITKEHPQVSVYFSESEQEPLTLVQDEASTEASQTDRG